MNITSQQASIATGSILKHWKTVYAIINTSWMRTLQTIISSRSLVLMFCLSLSLHFWGILLIHYLRDFFCIKISSTSEVIQWCTAGSWTTSEVNPDWGSYFSPTLTELYLVSFVSGVRLRLVSEVKICEEKKNFLRNSLSNMERYVRSEVKK